jgi:hypothetical protein
MRNDTLSKAARRAQQMADEVVDIDNGLSAEQRRSRAVAVCWAIAQSGLTVAAQAAQRAG